VLVILRVGDPRVIHQIPARVVLTQSPHRIGQLVQPIHLEWRQRPVVRPVIQITRRVYGVTPAPA